MKNTALALALMVLLVPVTGAGPSDTFAPSLVVADAEGDVATVSWVPGPVAADEYRVYAGPVNGTLVPLVTVKSVFQVEIRGDYDVYAVSGIKANNESAVVAACVHIQNYPPPPAITFTPPCSGLLVGVA